MLIRSVCRNGLVAVAVTLAARVRIAAVEFLAGPLDLVPSRSHHRAAAAALVVFGLGGTA